MMSVRDEELDEWERKYRQATLPDVLWNAVNRLRANSNEKVVQLPAPSEDFYLALAQDFREDMGIGFRQIMVDKDIYVIFRKCTEHYF